MKMYGNFIYQGLMSRPGVKDPSKVWNEVSLLDDFDQLKCMVTADLVDKVLPSIKPFTPCSCTFEYNARFASFRLVDISPVK